MNRFEKLSQPRKANKQRSLLHLVNWLNMVCAAGILLACATGAVALLSGGNFAKDSKSWTRSPQTNLAQEGRVLEVKASVADPGPFVLPHLSTVAPVSVVETGAPPPIIEAAQMVDQAETATKSAQNSTRAADATPTDAMPTFSIDQVISARPRRATRFPLSVNADGVVPDNSLIAIHGLPKGTVLSAGRPDGVDGWLLAPDDLGSGLFIIPGGGDDGSSDLIVQILTPERRIASELHARLVVSESGEVSNNHQVASSSSDEIQVLLTHGRELQRVGYLAGARLFFERAAEAGSAEGARALGETYDPVEFQKLGVHGMAPDPALARKWYDRARALEATPLKQAGTAESN
jgi:hypothetical protein